MKASGAAETPIKEPFLGAWKAVVQAHAAVTGQLQEALTEAGLPPLAWYELLVTLATAPERRLRMGELAEALVISRGGLTKLVDRLVKAGLVDRDFCAEDRRASYAVLLPAGEELLAEMRPTVAAELDRSLVGVLSDREAESIREGLDRVRNSACSGG
jgi:DNA-binding MarR family transcriptional regulator